MEELLKIINFHNGRIDLYTSVYSFDDIYNKNIDERYESAIIDRIYWDIDPYYTEKGTNIKIYIGKIAERSLRLSDKLLEDNISHYIVGSGSGVNIYAISTNWPIAPDNKKNTLYTIQKYYDDNFIRSDSLHGDLARISRFIGTRNMKFKRKDGDMRYCVVLNRKDLESGQWKNKIKTNTFKMSMVKGNKLIDLNYWEENLIDRFKDNGYNMYEDGIDESSTKLDTDWYCVNQSLKYCSSESKLSSNGSNRDRFIVLAYLFNTAYTSQQAAGICKNVFSDSVYESFVKEGQLKNIYKNGVNFPSIHTLINEGRCNECGMC